MGVREGWAVYPLAGSHDLYNGFRLTLGMQPLREQLRVNGAMPKAG
jgi:hypothetical protein